MNRIAIALLLTVPLLLPGCTPWATYPPVEGAAGLNEPGMEPIPTLMAAAIADRFDHSGGGDRIVYNLPLGVTESVYRRVERKLPVEGVPLLEAGDPAIHIVAIRIRTTEAEVDVIDGETGVPQMTTLSFRQDLFQGWTVKNRRRWRIHVAWPSPHYPGAPATAEAAMGMPEAEPAATMPAHDSDDSGEAGHGDEADHAGEPDGDGAA